MNGLGDALVDVLLRAVNYRRPKLRAVADWIVEVARPPRGVRLVADDGAEYSGLVLIEHNQPVLMFAVCVKGPRTVTSPSASRGSRPSYSPVLDESSWNDFNDDP